MCAWHKWCAGVVEGELETELTNSNRTENSLHFQSLFDELNVPKINYFQNKNVVA